MFKPTFTITPEIAQLLMHIEQIRHEIQNLPITPTVLVSLRNSARLHTTHYSTMIEGNQLTIDQVESIVNLGSTFPGRKREQDEILGYYAALESAASVFPGACSGVSELKNIKFPTLRGCPDASCVGVPQKIKTLCLKNNPLTEKDIQYIHALVTHGGKTTVKPTPYRDGQNAIYDSQTKRLVYLPPEAHDVKELMADLITWINKAEKDAIPCPLVAGIAHYQYATIHPYYDGNGRTARLLATIILHRGGYDLKGLYSLEEYYARNLPAYYDAISAGPSHNYYMGREQADITSWLNYFCDGMIDSFEKVKTHALLEYHKGAIDKSQILKDLDAQQQAILTVFQKTNVITSKDIEKFFALAPRTARALCLKWVHNNFLVLKDSAKKSRKYALHPDISKKLLD